MQMQKIIIAAADLLTTFMAKTPAVPVRPSKKSRRQSWHEQWGDEAAAKYARRRDLNAGRTSTLRKTQKAIRIAERVKANW